MQKKFDKKIVRQWKMCLFSVTEKTRKINKDEKD